MEEHGAARITVSSVEMGGLFGEIVGTGTIKGLRTPLLGHFFDTCDASFLELGPQRSLEHHHLHRGRANGTSLDPWWWR